MNRASGPSTSSTCRGSRADVAYTFLGKRGFSLLRVKSKRQDGGQAANRGAAEISGCPEQHSRGRTSRDISTWVAPPELGQTRISGIYADRPLPAERAAPASDRNKPFTKRDMPKESAGRSGPGGLWEPTSISNPVEGPIGVYKFNSIKSSAQL